MSKKTSCLAFLILLCVPLVFGQSGWTVLPSGIELYRSSPGKLPALTVLRVDPQRFEIATVIPSSPLGGAQASHSYSLQELQRNDATAVAISNGQATTNYNIPIPDGLLKTNGREVSPSNDHHPNGGVFCVTLHNRPAILTQEKTNVSDPDPFQNCRSAIQAGPVLIRDGQSVVNRKADLQSWERTVVAVDSDARLLLIVSESTTLGELVDRLLQLRAELKIENALNLDGSYSSGLIYRTAGSDYQKVGNTRGLIGSAIIVHGSK